MNVADPTRERNLTYHLSIVGYALSFRDFGHNGRA